MNKPLISQRDQPDGGGWSVIGDAELAGLREALRRADARVGELEGLLARAVAYDATDYREGCAVTKFLREGEKRWAVIGRDEKAHTVLYELPEEEPFFAGPVEAFSALDRAAKGEVTP